jgi:hypothetical protein
MTASTKPVLFQFADDLAKNWTPPPIIHGPIVARDGSNSVRLCGGALDEIWWQGRQWAVTAYGIELRSGQYTINAKRLLDDLPGYSWIMQVGLKGWADVDDFATAFFVAVAMHGKQLTQKNRAALLRHVEEARGYEKTDA